MDSGEQECPVCTLYLREGISLRQHLDTHPKDQVIDALLKIRTTQARVVEAATTPAAIEPQQMTTAVTYQQILTTNAAGTVVPQLLQVPALVNSPFSLPHNVGFAPQLFNTIYNPYVPQPFNFNGPAITNQSQRVNSPILREIRASKTPERNAPSCDLDADEPPPPSVIISRTRAASSPAPSLNSQSVCSPGSPFKEESVIVITPSCKSPVKEEKFEIQGRGIAIDFDEEEEEDGFKERNDELEPDCLSRGGFSYSQTAPEEVHVKDTMENFGFSYSDEAANLEEPVVYTDLVPASTHNAAYMELDGIRIFFNGAGLTSTKTSSVIQMADSTKAEIKDLSPLPLNIAADESMPARGELSEQESLGADSAWGLFQDVKVENWTTPKPYKCSLCNLSFACPKERRVHKNKFHQKPAGKSFRCMVCHMEFPNLRERRVHMSGHPMVKVKVEGEESTMRLCTICATPLPSLKSLRIHLREVHSQIKFKCETCEQCFDVESDMNNHFLIHPLKCPQCQKEFFRRANLNLHMKRHLPVKPFECNLCPKTFITRQKLEEHSNGHNGIRPIKCLLCNKTFSRHSNLIQHRNLYHTAKKKPVRDFVCRCGEIFQSQRKLEWHREIHDNKPKSCPFCSQKFIHAASVTRHIRRAHKPDFLPLGTREENVACPSCDKVCLRSCLTVHMRVHSGERPFHCNICSKQFTTKWNMELHQWTHQSRASMPFKCNQCKSAFFRESDHLAHMNAHKNLKPFICNVCGQKFIRKYNCLRHQEEHKRAKRFACSVSGCDRTFHRSYYLKDHMKVHTGVRPHTCHICGKSSSTKSNHNKHVRIHDTREPVNTEN